MRAILLCVMVICGLTSSAQLKTKNVKLSMGVIDDYFYQMSFDNVFKNAKEEIPIENGYIESAEEIRYQHSIGVSYSFDLELASARENAGFLSRNSLLQIGGHTTLGREAMIAYDKESAPGQMKSLTFCNTENELGIQGGYMLSFPSGIFNFEMGLGADVGYISGGKFLVFTDEYSSAQYEKNITGFGDGDISSQRDSYKSYKGLYYHYYIPIGINFKHDGYTLGMEYRMGAGNYIYSDGSSNPILSTKSYIVYLKMNLW